MNRSQRIRLVATGLVIVFVAASIALAFPRNGKKPIEVTAYFTKAIGLFKSSPVRVLGVDVGRVTSVEPQGTKVKVVMKIEADRKIPADARAVVVPISLIADRYVQMTPVYSSGPVLADGAVIDTDHTAIPAELDDLLAQLKKLLDAVQAGTLRNPESIGLAIKNLAAALQGAGDDLSATLSGAGALSSAVTDNPTEIDASVRHLSSLLAAIAAHRDDIARLNTGLAQALGAIASERSTLDSALRNIALLTGQLGSLVKEHRANLEADIAVLARTTRVVTKHQDSVIQSLDWLHVLADGAEESHYDGAIHTVGGRTHIDVRDAHLFPCPPAVNAAICLLTGLLGSQLPIGVTAPGSNAAPAAGTTGPTAGPPSVAPAATPAAPTAPESLLDLLPKLPLTGTEAETRSSPSLRDLFDELGGLLDLAFGWLM